MKKLFLMGFVALGLASCVSDKEVAPQTQDQKYTAAFESFVGGKVNPNVNWGFDDQTPLQFDADGELIDGLRGHDKNNNQWGKYVEVPDSINELIREKVTKYFTETKNPQGVAVNWSDYFCQQVSSTERGRNMDFLYSGGMKEEHINDFNNGNGGGKRNVGMKLRPNDTNNCVEEDYYDGITLMTNSSTTSFAFHNSYDATYYEDNYVIIPGEVIDAAYPNMQPSLAGMWFVGFDYEHDKTHMGENDIVERDFYFNDWIVRISPGIYKESDRVFAEDLIDGSLDNLDISDWDFNDAVFDVRFVTQYGWSAERGNYTEKSAIITLWAAGGTKSLTIAGREVHELFGQSTGTMINTNASGGVDGLAPVIFRVEVGDNVTNAIDIPVKVNGTELEAKQGDATQKMAVAYGTKWMKERKIITGSYTSFKDYVKNNDPLDWYKTVTNTGDLYTPSYISTAANKY